MTDGGSGLRGKLPLRDEWLCAVLNVMLSGRVQWLPLGCEVWCVQSGRVAVPGCLVSWPCCLAWWCVILFVLLVVLLGRGGALCCGAGELCYVVVVLCRCQSSRRAMR